MTEPALPHPLDTDRNLLFALLALQADLIDRRQFLEACRLWAARPETSLAGLLVEKGWLGLEGRGEVERLLRRKLARHRGDVRAALAELTGDGLRQTLAAVKETHVQAALPPRELTARDEAADETAPDERESWGTGLRRRLGRRPAPVNVMATVVVVLMAGLALAMMLFPAPKEGGNAQRRGRMRPGAGPQLMPEPQNETAQLVRSLFIALVRKKDVIEYIERDPALSQTTRKEALALAEEYSGNHPMLSRTLNDASWYVVRQPQGSEDDYRHALRLAEEASRLAPGDGAVLNTLGVAQYRVGRYADAVMTLTQSEELNRNERLRENPFTSDPADLAFLAMTHYRLGHKQKAEATLAQLRAVLEKHRWTRHGEQEAFLHEAEALISPKTGK